MPDFHRMTPDQVRAHRETVLLRLLIRVSQIETASLVDRLRERGHGEVQRSYVALLANVDTGGTQLVEIARRLGISRQAASQAVKDVERRGFLERTPDPQDGRAWRVRHTPDGRALLLDALAVMWDIEEGYATIVGRRRLALVREALRTIADATDQRTAL